MKRILIPYGTTEGLTAQISEYVADVVRGQGHEADAVDLKGSVDPEPDGYDAVIVGASIHMGKHEDYVLDFVRKNRDELGRLPSAFFSVSMAAHDNMGEAAGYIEEFVRETGWHPSKVGLFGGALLYTLQLHKAPPDEEDRPRQGQPGHRHLARLRVHGVGRRETPRRRVPRDTGSRSCARPSKLERRA